MQGSARGAPSVMTSVGPRRVLPGIRPMITTPGDMEVLSDERHGLTEGMGCCERQ
jgi:hypothetical protein